MEQRRLMLETKEKAGNGEKGCNGKLAKAKYLPLQGDPKGLVRFYNQFMAQIDSQPVSNRVAADLENLEKSGNSKVTSESQGICDRIPKVREFCCLKFIFRS